MIFEFEKPQFSMNIHDNSKNKKRNIDFSFDSAHCASFFTTEAKLRKEVCISSFGKYLRILFDILSVNKLSDRHFVRRLFVCSTFYLSAFCLTNILSLPPTNIMLINRIRIMPYLPGIGTPIISLGNSRSLPPSHS